MRKIFCFIFIFLAACSKDDNKRPALPEGSVSLSFAADVDTLEMPMPVLIDSTITIGLTATITGTTATTDHYVKFTADSTVLKDYKAQFGDALIMPSNCYYFYKSMVKLPKGATVTDSAQLNIVLQTKLKGYSTYVLPVKIESVDGNSEGIATDRIFYYVFKTGKPGSIDRTSWTISAFSSANGSNAASKVFDVDDMTTSWTSNINQKMPQFFTINFGSDVTFEAVAYYYPTNLKYPTSGGYPTSIQIETSLDGTAWVDKGIYAGNIVNNMQTLNTGTTTAHYLRFTVLSVVNYSTYNAVFVSGFKLIP